MEVGNLGRQYSLLNLAYVGSVDTVTASKFSGPVSDCRHARHSAVRRCCFILPAIFYAATGLCRDASNGA